MCGGVPFPCVRLLQICLPNRTKFIYPIVKFSPVLSMTDWILKVEKKPKRRKILADIFYKCN